MRLQKEKDLDIHHQQDLILSLVGDHTKSFTQNQMTSFLWIVCACATLGEHALEVGR